MIAVVQRVSEAQLHINGQLHTKIAQGFMVLLGIHETDTMEDVQYLSNKIIGLRIFSDAEGKMNLDLSQVNGDILLVSQFTLIASTKKGNRQSFLESAAPGIAEPLYCNFCDAIEKKIGRPAARGIFGADMQVTMVNDGPVTILMDSRARE